MEQMQGNVEIETKEYEAIVCDFLKAAGKETNEIWSVEVLYGFHEVTKRKSYVVKLICKLDEQMIYFDYIEFCDVKNLEKILRNMRSIGVAEQSYVRYLIKCVNEVITKHRNRVVMVDDLRQYLTKDMGDLSVTQYAQVVADHYKHNEHRFPTQSSKMYDKSLHDGVILDKQLVAEGTVVVAIDPPVLNDLIGEKSDNKYREILEGLVRMRLMEGDLNSRGRFDKKKVLADGVEPKVYVFHLNASLLKGVEQNG